MSGIQRRRKTANMEDGHTNTLHTLIITTIPSLCTGLKLYTKATRRDERG